MKIIRNQKHTVIFNASHGKRGDVELREAGKRLTMYWLQQEYERMEETKVVLLFDMTQAGLGNVVRIFLCAYKTIYLLLSSTYTHTQHRIWNC